MRPIWVLVADNSKASMYDFQPHQHQLHLLDSINHQEGRWHNGDFISDKNGNHTSMHSYRGIHNAGLGDTDKSPKGVESERFTKMIASAINHAYENHNFEALQVCAPPRFMGELMPHLKKDIPVHKVTKDLVAADAEHIMSHLTPFPIT
ncbi:host attachment protein [Parendozoicomonas haliclonae]|uniref:Protein required for attachment to host cell n=1 Tax=Parendozoicomonas haliclonae TaxID=1960125 RepID=A0A1X7AHR9_9GAMM|nr:host attachment protein [Parendozoicomonas haliclonae]SMA42005.1 Protein required for attachment to host cell [Parendozoicomonas haliclonae]